MRREQYAADITYGTNNEFGFDYLRDNMAWSAADLVQRGHNFAIVDEADSILIDEARTPLIISGPAEQSARWYQEFARMAPLLRRTSHYEVDERKRTVGVTEDGVTFVEDQWASTTSTRPPTARSSATSTTRSRSRSCTSRDKDYIVRDGQVLIVDEFTGRVLPAAATTRACTRPSRPRRGWRSRPRTRPWPPSPCRTTSASTPSSRA